MLVSDNFSTTESTRTTLVRCSEKEGCEKKKLDVCMAARNVCEAVNPLTQSVSYFDGEKVFPPLSEENEEDIASF